MKDFKPIELDKVKTYSIKGRKSKVSVDDLGHPVKSGNSFAAFLEGLPQILAAGDLKEIAAKTAWAHREEKVIALAMGAHVIKVGLGPMIIDFMEKGIINSIAMNGAGIVHDFELAYTGQTSEDVAAEIDGGTFGMAEETGRMLNVAIKEGVKKGIGIGQSVGEMINREKLPHAGKSILAAGARLNVPVTIHVAVGTDIIHMHPHADGAAIGQGSYTDFRLFSSVISRLDGGIYLNVGSAVLLPEVFLKALTLVRNLGHEVKNFSTVNMDFMQHYRPLTNVVKRPTQDGGKGYALTGHHEIMLPLLFSAVMEELGKE
ncbi:MAG: hypothetical protein OEV42_03720 [Deltaproteobacteria bacterium]|nr:hypothetical protein [Deltaproteobacteria bacterium]